MDAGQFADLLTIVKLPPYAPGLNPVEGRVAEVVAVEESEYALVLLHCDDPEEGTRRNLAREVTVTGTSAVYQRHLHEQTNRLVADGRFPMSMSSGTAPCRTGGAPEYSSTRELHRRGDARYLGALTAGATSMASAVVVPVWGSRCHSRTARPVNRRFLRAPRPVVRPKGGQGW
ncbi:hypothetical protein [Streptomyces sp. NPDC059918]|uniref:hypothetical protein n=1 Tax=unclassified Streptomyces TaxID=2593676 RepID=UPI00364A3D9B